MRSSCSAEAKNVPLLPQDNALRREYTLRYLEAVLARAAKERQKEHTLEGK